MKKLLVVFLCLLLVLPFVLSDVIMPRASYIYFEDGWKKYNNDIEFTIKGYGYRTGMPGSPDYIGFKEPGTYTPESVFSFSAKYTEFGDVIFENFYMNYRHIDYFELEGTTNGKSFIIKNIEQILTNCVDLDQYDMINITGYYKQDDDKIHDCREKYDPPWNECRKFYHLVKEDDLLKDPTGHVLEKSCELRFDLADAIWLEDNNLKQNSEEYLTSGFWQRISCFFKGLFGGSC